MLWASIWYILICVGLGLIVKYHWSRRELYSQVKHLKGPPALPILGNCVSLICKEDELFKNISRMFISYPSPIKLWLGPILVIGLKTAPEMEKVLTCSKFNTKADIYKFMKVFNGLSLFTTNGKVWKKQRKFVAPFLGCKYVESYFEIMKESSSVLVRKLENQIDKRTFDINFYIVRCYNDIVTEVLLGYNPEAQHGKMDQIINMGHRMYVLLHSRMVRIWLHPDFIFRLSPNGKEQMKGRAMFRKFLNKGLALIQSRGHDSPVKNISLLEQLMITQRSNPDLYKDQNLMDHIATLFSAAEDPISSISSYLLMLVGMYPEIQQKILEEIKTVLGNDSRALDYNDLPQLKYLDMCIKEVLRLFPIGPYILRKVNENVQLGDLILPKNCTVILSFYNVQRDPAYWEKPNEFFPEHFLPEAVAMRPPYAFLPFSSGARSCPGQFFAYAAMKLVAVTVLQNYVVEADGTLETLKLKADISIRPVDGYKIRIKKRI